MVRVRRLTNESRLKREAIGAVLLRVQEIVFPKNIAYFPHKANVGSRLAAQEGVKLRRFGHAQE